MLRVLNQFETRTKMNRDNYKGQNQLHATMRSEKHEVLGDLNE
jgi:hypothetical protein